MAGRRWWRRFSAGVGPRVRLHRGDRHRLRPEMMPLEDRRLLATFKVNSTADTLTAGVPTQGTLRWAIDQANATAGDNTIQFDASAFSMPQTILLTQGQLELSQAGTTETVTGPSTGVTVN